MSNPYENCPELENLSTEDRIKEIKRIALKMLKRGATPESLTKEIETMLVLEMYEAVRGIELAIAEFKENQQLTIL